MSVSGPGHPAVKDEMTCKELVELVTEYLEGTLPEADRHRLEEHLKDCPYCTRYIDQMRQVIRTLGRLEEDSLPPEKMNELLVAFRGWKGKPGS
jgi:predicted anti-sigma-YlaC factor YlaD